MNRTVEQTALLLAVILNRSELNRARISVKTIKILARRQMIRSTFIVDLISKMAENHDWIMVELASGGFGLIQAKSLEAARAITSKRLLTQEELEELKANSVDWSAYEYEVYPEGEEFDDSL